MKKNYLLFVLLFAAVSVIAQTKKTIDLSNNKTSTQSVEQSIQTNMLFNKPMSTKENTLNVSAEQINNFNVLNSLQKAKNDAFDVFYFRPSGTYLYGFKVSNQGLQYGWYPVIAAPALRDLKFEWLSNDSIGTATYNWTMNNGVVDLSSDVDSYGDLIWFGSPKGNYYVPELNGTFGTSTATYKYGAVDVDGAPIAQQSLANSQADVYPIANYDKWVGDGLYTGYSSTIYFGPGSTYQNQQQTAVGVLYEKPLAPLFIKDMDVYLSAVTGTSYTSIIPAGSSLTLTVYPVSDEGIIGYSTPIATATATQSNLFPISAKGAWAHFAFTEIDDLGLISTKTLLLETAFVVELSGYTSVYDFKMPIMINPEYGSTYAIYGGSIVPFFDSGVDILLNANGNYNAFEAMEGHNLLQVEPTGGYGVYLDPDDSQYYYGSFIYSSYDKDSITIKSKPSWITIAPIDNSYFAQYKILDVTITGEALPAGVTGRSGEIILNSKGTTLKLYVKQGDANWTGVSNTKVQDDVKASYSNNSFMLNYSNKYSSVSLCDITGKMLGTFTLSKDGRYSIPAANLAKGVYILKVSGNGNTETVKVIK